MKAKFRRRSNNPSAPFPRILWQHSHNGNDDCQFKLIEQCGTQDQLKKRETFWQHRLKMFYPYRLN